MHGHWAFHWTLWLLHHKKSMGILFIIATVAVMAGVLQFPSEFFQQWSSRDLSVIGLSVLAMSAVGGYLMLSWRSGGLMLLLSGLILASVLGAMGWLGITPAESDFSLLALIVTVTMMVSNLVHLLTGLHREMARGQFQHDALSDALQINMHPIVLSNVTTALGFIVAALADAQLRPMAWGVSLGAVLSLFVSVTWLPWILLNWFIECRVGEPKDRYGLLVVAQRLESHGILKNMLMVMAALLGVLAVGILWPVLTQGSQILWMMAGLVGLLTGIWRQWRYAVFLAAIALYSVLVVAAGIYLWRPEALTPWVLIIPLGIIIDDGIHFFVRYLRAKQGFFHSPTDAVRYTMASIGRPIWVTSLILLVGMSVLTQSSNALIQIESWIVIGALFLMTAFILAVLPAVLMREK